MSEWDQQISEFQRNWMKQQQALLGDWLGNLQNAGVEKPASMWQEAVAMMEQQVNSLLDIQKKSLLSLAENSRHVQGAPDAFSQWVAQLESGLESWTEVQRRLWEVWFDLLRSNAPAAAQTPGETLVKNWQDMMRRAISVQEQWFSNWMGSQAAAENMPAEKPAKTSAQKRPARSSTKGNVQD